MSLDLAHVAPQSSRPLYRLIRRTRLLLRVTRIAAGLALTVGLFLGALALVTAMDLLLPPKSGKVPLPSFCVSLPESGAPLSVSVSLSDYRQSLLSIAITRSSSSLPRG